eukprot:Phypoly_transcript_08828.p1 GENE.Phypoly_transcript_08828~~Phypoly_transcript_08828.p1  ORF type:complete len:242 (-),score=20.15 Phypoly_transcript_08828:50-775(-)
MSKLEFVSPEGYRIDGRKPNELRKIKSKLGIFSRADGSAYLEQGNTKVIAAVYGPREVTDRRKAHHDKAIINCEFSVSTFATSERRKRTKGDRRNMEIALIVKQTFEATVLVNLFPRSQIDIYIQVLQSDGGDKTAAINASTLALIDAGVPMRDFVCACAAGCIDGIPLLDLNYVEGTAGGPELPVALLPRTDGIVMLQMESRLPLDMFERVLQLASLGAHSMHNILKEAVRDHAADLLNK